MYNLVKFILKYHFVILFVLLEIIAGVIIFQNNKYHKVKFLNSANFLSGGIYSINSNINSYLKLKETNEKLAQENALLKSKTSKVYYTEVPSYESYDSLTNLDTLVVDSTKHLEHIIAKVIKNSIKKPLNLIYINKGTVVGFEENMGVVNKDGVIGVVRNISNNYAVVTPIINQELNLNAKIKNSGYFGNLSWDGNSYLYAQLYDIPNHIEPAIGDTIVTSGYSQVFEEGMLIGFIEGVENIPGKSFLKLNVKLAVDFGNLDYVYGIANPHIEELDSLILE